MDERNDIMGMLDLMVCPGFCVKNQKIEKLNPAAESLLRILPIECSVALWTGKAPG